MKHLVLLIFFLTFTLISEAQTANGLCSNPTPFCSTSPTTVQAGVNSGTAQAGPDYGCLGSEPNPAWFYMQMAQSGPVTIVISAANDVDFIAWGPFTTLNGNCGNLTAATQVPGNSYSNPTSNGCSYSGSATETLIIANANAGDFYILLVTNFSNANQPINITQTNVNNNGAGATNCGVVCGVTVTGTSSVCAGQSATLSVNTSTDVQSVTWTGPNGYIGSQFQQQVIPNLQSSETITITANTLSGVGGTCAITAPINVVANPVPTVFNNGPVCVGQTATLNAAGGTSYNWSGPGPLTNSSGPSTYLLNPKLGNSGVYSVTLTAGTCTSVGHSLLLVKPNPTVTVSDAGNFCLGKSFSLLSGGATTYSWSGPAGFTFQGQNPLFINNSFNMSGLYSVVGEVNGCTGTGTINVTILPLPNVIASSSGSVCQTSSLTLTSSGAFTYLWNGPAGFISNNGTVTINNSTPAMSGTYIVIGTDSSGCVNTATVFQEVQANPFVNVYSTNACINKDIQLSANGGSNYVWTGPASFYSTDQNPVISNVNPQNTGIYTVVVKNAFGCKATASVEAVVYQNPNVTVSGNMQVCKGKSFYFTAGGASDYKWLNSTGIVTQNTLFAISSVAPNLQSTYTLVGTDGHFCSNFVPFYPIVNDLPSANILPDLQQSCVPFCTAINLQPRSNNIVESSWEFSDGEILLGSPSSHTKCFTLSGIYTLSISLTDANTCTSVVTQTIQGEVTPAADFIYTPDKPTENDNIVTFIDATRNISVQNWSWSFYLNQSGTIKDTSIQESPTRKYNEVGNYLVYLKVTAINGCTDSIAKILVLAEDPTFFIPNAFTPNDDNLNDVFLPKSMAVASFEMHIYNRWGQLLFSSNDPTKGWDGKSGGEALPNDIYTYKFIVTDINQYRKVYKGQFSLIK